MLVITALLPKIIKIMVFCWVVVVTSAVVVKVQLPIEN
jgi:hypothetical protein